MKRKFVALLSCALLFTACGGQNVQPEPGPQPEPKETFNITIYNAEQVPHFHSSESVISFTEDDFAQKSTGFELDDGYTIHTAAIYPTDAALCTFAKNNIYITPLTNANIYVGISTTNSYKSITFHPGPEGSELGDDASEVIRAPIGKHLSECFDKEKQVAKWHNYDFAGWSANNDSQGHGAIIEPSYVITENTFQNVYGSYVHHVNLTSESIEVRRFDYGYEHFRIYLSLKDSTKYDFPINSSAFSITDSDGENVTFEYQTEANERYISFTDPSEVSDGIININIEDYQPTYAVTDDLGDGSDTHLRVISTLGDARKGEDYTFTIEAINNTNELLWYIPEELRLTHGDGKFPLNPDGYRIELIDGDLRQKANVTIFGDYVNDKIGINGFAAHTDAFYYTFTGYGVSVQEGREEGYVYDDGRTLELQLSGEDVSSVTTDNIAFVIDRITYAYDELSDRFKQYIKFNENLKTIGLYPGLGTIASTIHIHVMSPNYKVFENSSWETINEICEEGLAEIFFVVGEVKHNIQIGNNTYSARIIGFNHDTLVSTTDKKAALTIEFVELITDNGVLHKDIYSGQYIGVFNGGVYDKYLNNEFMDKLPTELSSVIKKVEKKVTTYKEPDPRTYQTKIFPLSMSELNYRPEYYKSEGSTYEYYDNNDKSTRAKCPCGSTDAAEYWTRSHSPSFMDLSYKIKTSGNHDDDYMNNKYGYMAAFCI